MIKNCDISRADNLSICPPSEDKKWIWNIYKYYQVIYRENDIYIAIFAPLTEVFITWFQKFWRRKNQIVHMIYYNLYSFEIKNVWLLYQKEKKHYLSHCSNTIRNWKKNHETNNQMQNLSLEISEISPIIIAYFSILNID